jgi:hypothetical protein
MIDTDSKPKATVHGRRKRAASQLSFECKLMSRFFHVAVLFALSFAPLVNAQDRLFASGFEPPTLGAAPLPAPTGPLIWVSPSGVDTATGTQSNPLRTVAAGCARAQSGDTIRLTAGEFQETQQCELRSGVRLMGDTVTGGLFGAPTSIVRSPIAWDYTSDGTNDNVAGYQVLLDNVQNITIDRVAFTGNSNKANGAIRVRNSSNVTLRDLDIRSFRFTGLNMSDSNTLDVQNIVLFNAGYEWPPGSSVQFPDGGSVGHLGIYGLTDALFQWFKIGSNARHGYGIKSANLTRVKIRHFDFEMYPFQSWMGPGPGNFDMELHGGFADRVELAYNTFRQTVSLVGGNDPRYTLQPYSLHVHHNMFDMRDGVYSIEAVTDRMVVDHNWFRNSWTALQHYGDASSRMKDLTVFNNVVENMSMRFVGLKGRVENVRLFNNTVYLSQGGGQSYLLTIGNTNQAKNFQLANNALVGFSGNDLGSRAFIVSYQTDVAPRDVQIKNNVHRDVPVHVNINGTTVAPSAWGHAYSSNLEQDPGLVTTGPTRYVPTASSAVVDRGDSNYGLKNTFVGAARDAGAFEFGEPVWTAGFGTSSQETYLWAPTTTLTQECFVTSVSVPLIGPAGASIRYTLDGTEPGPNSTLYTGPITVSSPSKLRARSFQNGVGSATALFVDLCQGVQGYPNLALASTPSASSNYPEPAYSPQMAIDNITYSWQGWAPAVGDPSSWLQLDLGSARRIRLLELYTRASIDSPETRRNFEIRGSNDPTFATYTVLAAQGATSLVHESVFTQEVTNATPFRYIRAQKTQSEFFFVAELRVLGE